MNTFEELVGKNDIGNLTSGDILLLESKGSWLDRVIKFIGRSQFTHTAMLVDIKGSWFVVESRPRHQQHAYQMMPADWWVERNKGVDAYVGKMPTKGMDSSEIKRDIESKIKASVLNPKWSVRPYKLTWCAIVVFLQWLGIKRPSVKKYGDESEHPMICSTLVQEAWENAGVIDKGNYKSPGNIAELSSKLSSLSLLKRDTAEESSDNNYLPDNYNVSSFSMMNAS